ncbi:MAG: hypothetical protein HOO00_00475 [Rhodospirillaceae bacterium]|jgi:hypothetical protein|nr:hypothetical protein [Rhodospirillaceae bacterium]MBT5751916.1 hypothetical protein [Rhodospirillaceae bacterium]
MERFLDCFLAFFKEGATGRKSLWAGFWFFLALAVFLISQILTVYSPGYGFADTPSNDRMDYILKAAQFDACPLQDCPALEHLRGQLDPLQTGEVSVEGGKFHQESHRVAIAQRLFSVYHPVYSLFLFGLHETGLSWAVASQWVELATIVVFILGLAFWLRALWGPLVAALAILVMSVHATVFPYPSNAALAVAMVVWAALTGFRERMGWLLPPAMLVMIGLHPLGRVYAAVTLVVYLAFLPRPWKKHHWLIVILGAAVIVLPWVLPLIVAAPQFSIPSYPLVEGRSFLYLVAANWWQALLTLPASVSVFSFAGTGILPTLGGTLIVFLLFLVGLTATDPARRSPLVATLAAFALALAASAVQFQGYYSGVAFTRVWIPMFYILFGGAMAGVLWLLPSILKTSASAFRVGFYNLPIRPGEGLSLLATAFMMIGVVVLLVAGTVAELAPNLMHKLQRPDAARLTAIAEPWMDSRQPERLRQVMSADDSVIYVDNDIMNAFLLSGLLERKAVYWPSLQGRPDKDRWIGPSAGVAYAVAMNPALALTNGSGIPLEEGVSLAIEGDGVALAEPLYLRFRALGEKTEITLGLHGMPPERALVGEQSVTLAQGESKWVLVTGLGDGSVSSVTMNFSPSNEPVFLDGISDDPESGLFWPWNRPLLVVSGRKKVKFDLQSVFPFGQDCLVGPVLDDMAMTLFARAECGQHIQIP